MLDHISISVGDLARSKAFYDTVLAQLGSHCLHEDQGSLGYGTDQVSFWVLASESPVPANEAPGLHICFAAGSRQSVDSFHAAALRNGEKDSGEPGFRQDYDPNYYAAFAVDPDGYRSEACCGGAE